VNPVRRRPRPSPTELARNPDACSHLSKEGDLPDKALLS